MLNKIYLGYQIWIFKCSVRYQQIISSTNHYQITYSGMEHTLIIMDIISQHIFGYLDINLWISIFGYLLWIFTCSKHISRRAICQILDTHFSKLILRPKPPPTHSIKRGLDQKDKIGCHNYIYIEEISWLHYFTLNFGYMCIA